ncbi:MAG: aminotransferase class I/II-fold pyridoxal phosphate-dependent enzyme [Rhodothermaceae bacterium]|nr:aminotransferase class I/II-fold pyridoxal phosphate-dependent enzyme [Rhodothermaceae bacterium]MXZ17130.1 aminotransferase class I/II-fold pyridoxal phosphate-dependent enzyme [Rhodothermaceae bacterium]MYC03154.1 aminotransferase class I/II-fold pyridoxal phosphate-dependent enzyme [Rhodothermaceae bacterium]MYE62090.1 aminotransferase class I/II-fold pyridoxal phosphate-dependent enzyme [Rhodothermaceae bacterium]MYG70069.1 aminotransferase class I/II-fold pyridoxal phosphate-dependent e
MTQAIDTQLIHAGEERRIEGAIRMPIFQTAMFEHDDSPLRYIRYNNTPNQIVLNRKLAILEGAEEALVTGSGMAAISGALLTVLKPGDHLLAQDTLYGGTHGFVRTLLADLGVSVSFFDADAPETWNSLLQANTRAVYVESITNPLLHVCDLERIVAFAQANKLVSLIDNTFATPFNYPASAAGFDFSLHSATKYLNGHSDVVAGVIAGRGDWVRKAGKNLKQLGGSLDPHACFLLHRGVQTLALRMRQHNATAHALAEFLDSRSEVAQVYHPGLKSHPQNERAARLFEGFSGMLSIELKGGLEATEKLMSRLQIPVYAPSLGGIESLMTRPAISSHAGLTPEERKAAGIRDFLLRISVGIEDCQDLIDDFDQALN